jgi:outer membrane protein TolC
MKRAILLALAIATLLPMLAGCGMVRPDAMTFEENAARAKADRKVIDVNYVPLTGPLDLAEAIARALKYNYDAQLARAEITLQERQLDLAAAQMLPRLAANAGYDARNSYNAAQSINVFTQQPSLVYSYSTEPQYSTLDLTLTWNALDLGLSYFQAKQQGYRVLIAVERRRKVIDNIVRSTANAYWRAQSAAVILPRLDPLLDTARKALEASRAASALNLQSPLNLLDFQQNMVIVLSELERIKNDLASARIELATLINIPNSQTVTFVETPESFSPYLAIDNHQLEDIGLALRPELRIESYQQKVARQDVYKEALKMLPGVSVIAGFNYNSDNLLYYSTWGALGMRATFNLFNLIQGPRAMAAAKEAVALAEQRRIALSVAILSQINLSITDYVNALDAYKTAQEVDRVGQEIGRVADSATEAGAQSETDRVRRQLTVLTARVSRDRAQTKVLASLAAIYASTGMDLVPAGAEFRDLPTLSEMVRRSIRRWMAGQLPELLPAQSSAVTATPVATASNKKE